MKILTEASGSLTSGYLSKAIQEAGHQAIGSDITDLTAWPCLSDEFLVFPSKDDPDLWEKVEHLLVSHAIEAVIPSFDEMLAGWASRIEHFAKSNIHILISPHETIKTFQDKWDTYLFFKKIGVPTPNSSRQQEYPLVKPRFGRGSAGVAITAREIDMSGMISQEIAEGVEYSIDCFFDRDSKPVYIVPRKRIDICNGKSTKGVTEYIEVIEQNIVKIAQNIPLKGLINMQCFLHQGHVSFIEINPRAAGGMALGFAATENWVPLLIENLLHGKPIEAKETKWGLTMVRYYTECFFNKI